MIKILLQDTPQSELPTYLLVVTEKKLDKYQNSRFKCWKRYLLESNGIWLMNETLDFNKENILFHNNDKKYDTVYKKMKINEKTLYIPIEEYSKFYLDHKIKISTSIVEMLGVFSIHYVYSELATELISTESSAEYSNITISNKVSSDKKNQIKNNDFKKYDKSDCPFLFYTPENFENEIKKSNDYFMDWDEYKTDFDLKNLVRSRLIGNLSEYTLKYEIDFMNNFEIALTSKLYIGFGLHFKKNYHKKLNVSLKINFFRTRDLINSDNMIINDNRCLQLILKGPSPTNYYDNLSKTTIQSEHNIQPPISPICNNNTTQNNILLFNFIDKYIEEKYKQKHDTDDIKSYYAFYNFIKIADIKLLHSYMNEVRNLDDLDENGIFFIKLRSTAFASLLSFDDEGLKKIQKIYLNIYRQLSHIKNNEDICYNFKCSHNNCQSPCRYLKRIYIYIIRVYNHECPDKIITFENDIDEPLTKVLHNITNNIVILPNYNIFKELITKELSRYVTNQFSLLM